MNICIISGSARADNNTIRVAKALKRLFAEHRVTLVDFRHYDIPLLTQGDVDMARLTPFQKELVDSLTGSDVTIIISPEYNWSTTPEILNMLHRLGEREYRHIFDQCVFALVGVSSGKGGKAPALHLTTVLNKIIGFMDLDSVVSARIFESHFTKEVLDENGNSLGNDRYDKGLQDFVNYTLRIGTRWKP